MPKLSSSAIQAKIDRLQKQLKSIEADKQPAIKKVRLLMKKLGISISDLQITAGKTSPVKAAKSKSDPKHVGKRGKVPAKFRDSVSGNEWSGRGKTPIWLIEAEKHGRSRESFRI